MNNYKNFLAKVFASPLYIWTYKKRLPVTLHTRFVNVPKGIWSSKDTITTICTTVHNANHNVQCTALKVHKFISSGHEINKRLLALPVCAVVKVYFKILPEILCILSNNTCQTPYCSTRCILFYSSSEK
jgi:hypothetical protein